MNEEWKDIINYEELYQISNKGNILNKKKDKLMTNTLNIKGYLVVKLSKIINQNNLKYIN